MSGNTATKNIKICEELEELVSDSIKRGNVVSIEKFNKLYLELKEILENNNNNVKEWYDEQYHENVFDLNININKFAKLICGKSTSGNSSDIFSFTY